MELIAPEQISFRNSLAPVEVSVQNAFGWDSRHAIVLILVQLLGLSCGWVAQDGHIHAATTDLFRRSLPLMTHQGNGTRSRYVAQHGTKPVVHLNSWFSSVLSKTQSILDNVCLLETLSKPTLIICWGPEHCNCWYSQAPQDAVAESPTTLQLKLLRKHFSKGMSILLTVMSFYLRLVCIAYGKVFFPYGGSSVCSCSLTVENRFGLFSLRFPPVWISDLIFSAYGSPTVNKKGEPQPTRPQL